ncbi:thioredoxin family protein [Actinoalloteichus spitiensis]|uniref:thioredoxin family protein n=1 Tax=Actinoalloteichus spitiensis TaxID=252394 RepID=UPI0003702697|nr:thioredoxin family protein [Actinoalloteichus spitiensis]
MALDTGLVGLLAALAAAGGLGVVHRARQGRPRTVARRGENAVTGVPERVRELAARLLAGPEEDGRPATVALVQLSSTFCAPCRHTRVVLARLARSTPGLRHTELDLATAPEVGERLRISRTPTTLVLRADGSEAFRFTGVPKQEALAEALAPLLAASPPPAGPA